MNHDAPPLQLFRMINGMWVSQIVSTFAELSLADHIHAGITSSDELAVAANANPDGTYRLLRGAMTIGLVSEAEGKKFALTPVGECLRSDAPGSLRSLAIAEAAHGHWAPWGRLVDAVRTGQPTAEATLGVPPWEYYAKEPEEGLHFAKAMGNLSAIAAIDVIKAFDATPYKQIVDVGGSQGLLLQGVLSQATEAHGILFDLPEVIEGGRESVTKSASGDRIELVAGSFLESVPAGADLYLLKHILHDWDDEHCRTILRNVHAAGAPGSHVLIVEWILPETAQPSPAHLMDLNMLVMLGGRERSVAEFGALLAATGFELKSVTPTEGMFTLIEGVRV